MMYYDDFEYGTAAQRAYRQTDQTVMNADQPHVNNICHKLLVHAANKGHVIDLPAVLLYSRLQCTLRNYRLYAATMPQ